jgi:hypothetical protein
VLRRACNVTGEVPLPSQVVPAPSRQESAQDPTSSSALPSSLVQVHGPGLLDGDIEDVPVVAAIVDTEQISRNATAGPSRRTAAATDENDLQAAAGSSLIANEQSSPADVVPVPPPTRSSRPTAELNAYKGKTKEVSPGPATPYQPRIPLAEMSSIQRGKQPLRLHLDTPPAGELYTAPVQPGEGSYANPGALPTNEKKRKAQHDRFMAEEGAIGDGPYKYYGGGESKLYTALYATRLPVHI